MKNGWLIYHEVDYKKNKIFADGFVDFGETINLNIKIVLVEDLLLGLKNSKLIASTKQGYAIPNFVINRSRDSFVGRQFELLGCKVFNSSYITDICNDKAKTHQVVNSMGIPSVDTLFFKKKDFHASSMIFDYPVVIKTVEGHGGTEVFKAQNIEELIQITNNLDSDFIIQKLCGAPGKDVRIFIIGNEIIGAVKRYSESDFRANYSLGGKAEKYTLNESELSTVSKLLSNFRFDFVGIDFIFDEYGSFLFNEIEDVVGSKTLRLTSSVDVIKSYLNYISNELNKHQIQIK